MSYYIKTEVEKTFDEAVQLTIDKLNEEGFGILTDIDVQATLKKKLNKPFRRYRILGACNPPFAYQALQTEDKVGTMLPCNVVVQELTPDRTEVAAIDPLVSMQGIQNEELRQIAGQIRSKLERVIAAIERGKT